MYQGWLLCSRLNMPFHRNWGLHDIKTTIRFQGGSNAVTIFSMQFLSFSRRLTEQFPPEAFTSELSAEEGQRVKSLYASGILRQIWRRGDMPGAAIIWEAGSEDEVRAAIESLPIFQAGMLELVALIPLEPYPGFVS